MPLDANALTWAALLAKWIEFARASVALPQDDSGRAWKQSVAPIIELQAVTCALGELNVLPDAEVSVARDKAEVIVDRAETNLREVWEGQPLPEEIETIVRDARVTLRATRSPPKTSGRG